MTTKQIWINYSEDLKRFILSKVKDEAVADDILQDTFIKIHTKLDTLKNVSKLKPWIFSIARNVVLDYFKTTNQSFEMIGMGSEFENEVHMHTEKECLRGILSGLPKKYREPLILSDIRGMKQSEIAKKLNLYLPTVKSQIQRARKLVVKGFMDCCGFTENDKGVLVGEIKEREYCKVCH